jgi:hypothetical protein
LPTYSTTNGMINNAPSTTHRAAFCIVGIL